MTVHFHKVLCASASLWLIFLLTGCEQVQDPAIRFGLAQAPITLDPRFATDAASYRVNRLLYCPLVEFGEDYRPRPRLARWERVGARRYRFTLLDRCRRFSDGRHLSARDVVATYRSVLARGSKSPHKGSLSMVESVETPDEETVEFRLSRPDPLFPGRLTLGILPAALIEAGHPFREQPVGSGPFNFLAWPAPGELHLLRRSDGQEVVFLKVPDATVRVLKLLRGEIDLTQGDLPAELLRWTRKREGVRVLSSRGDTFAYIGFNLADPVTGDPRVRRAVALALDREAIIRYLLGGHARPAAAILPPDHWAGYRGGAGFTHDPAAARRLLREVGYGPDHPLRLTYKTSSNAQRLRIATVIQDQLRAVGIQVDIRSYDWGTFYSDIKAGRFQMYSLAWVGLKMPDIFRYVFHSASVPPAGANRGRYADPQVDALIEQAEGTEDEREQAGIYRRIQRRLLETLPYVPLWYEDQVALVRAGITGYRVWPDGRYDALASTRKLTP
ncbi:MAG: ABC transporter substrate-binding protein [Gammaproteobacteria bacterium]|nr:MAG: ABC transporter substrate-binding protein [Gammaproteobacteria bacterium]